MEFALLRSQNQIFSTSQILLLCLLVELCEISEVREHFLFFFLLSSGWNKLTGQQGIFQGWKQLPFLWIIGSPVDRVMGVWHRNCTPTAITWRR